MSELVVDASLALQWFLEDELDRGYSLSVLERLADDKAVVPLLWFYEIGNGLTSARRRNRITSEQATDYVERLRRLPIVPDDAEPSQLLTVLPDVALKYQLTNYDAAYLELAIRRKLPLGTTDQALRRAAVSAGVPLVTAPPLTVPPKSK